ncbi:Glycosaminoglycan xylosylkinase [Fukomys damarensis]|uniref:Glycosaminoglycan xylosylkinase n=1 Tax=Fukomys damarensis TaxID=885580 RepID=A0A091D413_FUKDA|nr:Glycosaminoglycan xylosylkinase [Fukomys damarensis]
MLILLGKAKSFGDPSLDERSILVPLCQCCTWNRLNCLKNGALKSALKSAMAHDPVAPVLSDPHLETMDQWLLSILVPAKRCTNQFGMDTVLVEDGMPLSHLGFSAQNNGLDEQLQHRKTEINSSLGVAWGGQKVLEQQCHRTAAGLAASRVAIGRTKGGYEGGMTERQLQFVQPSDGREELVSGGKVVAQALKAQPWTAGLASSEEDCSPPAGPVLPQPASLAETPGTPEQGGANVSSGQQRGLLACSVKIHEQPPVLDGCGLLGNEDAPDPQNLIILRNQQAWKQQMIPQSQDPVPSPWLMTVIVPDMNTDLYT